MTLWTTGPIFTPFKQVQISLTGNQLFHPITQELEKS